MPTLTADAGSFVLSGALSPRLWAEGGSFVLAGTGTELNRSYTADLGLLALNLDRLNAATSYWNDRGQPTLQMQLFWKRHCEAIELAFSALRDSVLAIQTAYNAASQASQAASAAQTAVVEVQAVADTATQLVNDLQSGDLNLSSITIGGTKFGNKGDVLEPLV